MYAICCSPPPPPKLVQKVAPAALAVRPIPTARVAASLGAIVSATRSQGSAVVALEARAVKLLLARRIAAAVRGALVVAVAARVSLHNNILYILYFKTLVL